MRYAIPLTLGPAGVCTGAGHAARQRAYLDLVRHFVGVCTGAGHVARQMGIPRSCQALGK